MPLLCRIADFRPFGIQPMHWNVGQRNGAETVRRAQSDLVDGRHFAVRIRLGHFYNSADSQRNVSRMVLEPAHCLCRRHRGNCAFPFFIFKCHFYWTNANRLNSEYFPRSLKLKSVGSWLTSFKIKFRHFTVPQQIVYRPQHFYWVRTAAALRSVLPTDGQQNEHDRIGNRWGHKPTGEGSRTTEKQSERKQWQWGE